ncbi:hypothetical protein CYMTET_3915 [Cymbomonas tetramitiformis]|uniref:Uncharacterized protein n=1 Tax=Cymbomonas tetramitiformis TaxID=36881 RepID=A0AAE0LKK6_9CHLO|nr:hypothetical protein CYMTET_3915 [Cymbomonas tetramitiformis]
MAGPHGEDPIAAQEDETPKEWDYMLREFDGSRLDGSEPRPDAPMEDTEERGAARAACTEDGQEEKQPEGGPCPIAGGGGQGYVATTGVPGGQGDPRYLK